MTYREKLLDPRWQRKRLEILQRDSFKCRLCKSTTDTLHVHHLKYERGKDPWDIDDKYLITLCEGCHSMETFERQEIEAWLIRILRERGYTMADLMNMISKLPEKEVENGYLVIEMLKTAEKK